MKNYVKKTYVIAFAVALGTILLALAILWTTRSVETNTPFGANIPLLEQEKKCPTFMQLAQVDCAEVDATAIAKQTQLDQLVITRQSATYPDCIEELTITDQSELSAFLTSLYAAKLVKNTVPQPAMLDMETVQHQLVDTYQFVLAGQEMTLFTKAGYDTMFLMNDYWYEVEFGDNPTLATLATTSGGQRKLFDQYGLAFYPQTWQTGATELSAPSYGIDVSYHQGLIDWAQVAQDGVDFAMIRVGVRYSQRGTLEEDVMARYNLQEASKYGIAVGVYIFSTAISEEEIQEEVALTLDVIEDYPITYPVVYNCEGFDREENRNHSLTVQERSALADLYLSEIQNAGYTPMFYASQGELEQNYAWMTNELQAKYRIWVAQYPGHENGATPEGTSNYSGRHEMWQYTASAEVAGIAADVDRNVAYFSYSALATVKGDTPETVAPSLPVEQTESGANGEDVSTEDTEPATEDGFKTIFEPVNEQVTAKEMTNLRNMPSVTNPASEVIAVLMNGDIAVRTGVSAEGFSRVEYQGQVLYCVSSYLWVLE